MRIEFFYDFGSPAAYLAWTQLPRLEAAGEVAMRPFLLGGVFKATGNASPVMVAAKGAWMTRDMKRWAKRYGVPLRFPKEFPVNTLLLMRAAAGLEGDPRYAAYVRAVFEAMFGRGEAMGEPATVGATLKAAGFDPAELMALAEDAGVKNRLKASTEEAVARGAFGAPTFFVGEEMHFGNDRVDWVIEAARAA